MSKQSMPISILSAGHTIGWTAASPLCARVGGSTPFGGPGFVRRIGTALPGGNGCCEAIPLGAFVAVNPVVVGRFRQTVRFRLCLPGLLPPVFAMSSGQADKSPNIVALFSGHMIDAPDRKVPRFPPDKEPAAAAAIAAILSEIGATRGDLAICGGACGGDLLFAEACLTKGMVLALYIPFDEPSFLANSVDFADADWHERFLAVKSKATLHVMPDELGELRAGENAYERNNQWMLQSAARFGGEKIAFVALWNGEGGDGPGGTKHLMDEARRKTGRIYWLDTRNLWD
jgi:hypothetical protein